MKNIIIVLLVIFVSNAVLAQETEMKHPERIIGAIQKLSKQTNSIQADFVQEKKLDYLKESQVSSGKFYSQEENMRWEQIKPSQYIMLVSATEMKIKEKGKEREFGAAADKYLDQIKGILKTSMTGNFTESDDFKPSYFENNSFYIVKLIPVNKRLAKMFDTVKLEFDKNTFRLKVLTFVQSDGTSSMTFSNEIFNELIPLQKFTNF